MTSGLVHELARFVYGFRLGAGAPAMDQVKALVLDALAAIAGGMGSHEVQAAETAVGGTEQGDTGRAPLLGRRRSTSPATAAFVHGAALRYLDIMDYYVAVDVSHPSEVIPAVLAFAQAGRLSGQEAMECIAAGYAIHMALTESVPLHSVGLHHAGHAAVVVPLVVSRLRGFDLEHAAAAASISAARFILPEGFAKGHLASVKALAYPLLARQAIEAVELASRGYAGNLRVLEEIFEILRCRFGADVSEERFREALSRADLDRVMVKAYPAQYTLQGLIAGAAGTARHDPDLWRRIARIELHSSARSLERTADPAKFKPASREAADHSMPFCVAIALMEGGMDEVHLERSRWADADVLGLMARMTPHPLPGDLGFHAGSQSLVLHLEDGVRRVIDCAYPPPDEKLWNVALRKLRHYGRDEIDADRIAANVAAMETWPDVSRLW